MKTKYCLLLLMTVVLTSLTASSQLRYGFRLGGAFAKASLSEAPGMSLRNGSGFSGGLLLEYQMESNGLAPDIALLYTRYSTWLNDATGQPAKIARNFIEVPLHLKYKFSLSKTNNMVMPMVYTGPSLLFRLGKGDVERRLSTRTVQPGWDVGIGIDIINFIQLSAGYRFGLGNTVSSCAIPGARLYTNGWNVAVNMIFDF